MKITDLTWYSLTEKLPPEDEIILVCQDHYYDKNNKNNFLLAWHRAEYGNYLCTNLRSISFTDIQLWAQLMVKEFGQINEN